MYPFVNERQLIKTNWKNKNSRKKKFFIINFKLNLREEPLVVKFEINRLQRKGYDTTIIFSRVYV